MQEKRRKYIIKKNNQVNICLSLTLSFYIFVCNAFLSPKQFNLLPFFLNLLLCSSAVRTGHRGNAQVLLKYTYKHQKHTLFSLSTSFFLAISFSFSFSEFLIFLTLFFLFCVSFSFFLFHFLSFLFFIVYIIYHFFLSL